MPELAVESFPRASRPRRFYLGFAMVAAALVLAGFSRTFFLPVLRRTFTAPWFVYVHGTLFLVWITLLVSQASLVVRRQVALHRRLGRAAVVLIPCMVISAVVVASWATARDYRVTPEDRIIAFYFGELMDMVMFGGLATAAYLMRRRPAVHKRLMLLATLALLGAAIGRIPVIGDASNSVTLAMLGAIVVADLMTLRRVHYATLIGGAAFLLGVYSEEPLGATPQWLKVGSGIISHVHYGLRPN